MFSDCPIMCCIFCLVARKVVGLDRCIIERFSKNTIRLHDYILLRLPGSVMTVGKTEGN